MKATHQFFPFSARNSPLATGRSDGADGPMVEVQGRTKPVEVGGFYHKRKSGKI